MSEPMTLLEFLRELLTNEQARDWYADDPDAALKYYGLDDLSPADVHDALTLIEDNQTADFDREYNTGHNEVHFPSPPPVPVHYEGGDHEAAVEYLNRYITNNYVNDQDTIVDNSTNQQIDTHGGDFDQDIDVDSVVASGDGSVAAGGDIDGSTIVSGDGNQVGDGNVSGHDNVVGDGNNVISGDGNTAAFGDGDANSASFDDVSVGNGGAISVGGDASGDYDVEDSFNETNTTVNTHTEYDDSFNEDNDSTSNSFNESHSSTDVDSHDETVNHVGSHNDVDIDH
ncbi:IniB N-terminal domain-containing protein [Pseudonocardia xinjiangensis]|uniref:IniB N-terminal domain-containing protein n=1 Tax=Pseudonocardia xinjiangensis TaxID=75289 RepID=UPI003D915C67